MLPQHRPAGETHDGVRRVGELDSDSWGAASVPIVGAMITSTIHVLILVPLFFALMKARALLHSVTPVSLILHRVHRTRKY